jgi:sec-independent protein translocase protein TatA
MFLFRNPTADLIVVLLIVLLIFGPKRLPGLGKQLGQGIREFKDSITGKSDDEPDDAERPAITPAGASTPTATTSDRESAEVGSERRS